MTIEQIEVAGLAVNCEEPQVDKTVLSVADTILGNVHTISIDLVGGELPVAQMVLVPSEIDVVFTVVDGSEKYIGKTLRVIVEEYDKEVVTNGEDGKRTSLHRVSRSAIYDGNQLVDDIVVARILASYDNDLVRGEVYTMEDYKARIAEIQKEEKFAEEEDVI